MILLFAVLTDVLPTFAGSELGHDGDVFRAARPSLTFIIGPKRYSNGTKSSHPWCDYSAVIDFSRSPISCLMRALVSSDEYNT